ncbi:15417_t:CDS:1, partial [Cetraspora pellucida]
KTNIRRKPNVYSGRKPAGVWKHFNKGNKYNNSHYDANCNYCKNDCYGEPKKMSIHLLHQCKPAKSYIIDIEKDLKCIDFTDSQKRIKTIRDKERNKKDYLEKQSRVIFPENIYGDDIPSQVTDWISRINNTEINKEKF